MIIRIIAVGRLKESFWQAAASDYARRLRSYARLEVIEVASSTRDAANPSEEKRVMEEEARAITERLMRHQGPVIALDRKGEAIDSLQMAKRLQEMILEGKTEVAFVIGGPLGLTAVILKRADLVLSFSKMTFPHQMMRIILLEQIYRSFRIIHHEPYHK